MSASENKFLKNVAYIIFFTCLFIFTCAVTLTNHLPIKDGSLFLLFQIGGIVLPGAGLILMFARDISLSSLELFIFSYASGYILNIVLYFLLMPLHLQKGLLPLLIIFDLFAVYMIRKNHSEVRTPEKADLLLWGGFLFLLLAFVFVVYCGDNMLPTALEENAYYTDILFGAGDAIELSHNFPPRHFRNVNQTYFYHYFSSIQLSVMHLVTGTDIVKLNLLFLPFQSILLLVSSALLLFRQVMKKNSTFYTFAGMLIVLFTTGNEYITSVNYFSHMYKAPFGFDISAAFGMFALLFLIKQFQQPAFHRFYYIMAIFSFFVCLGAKGPIGSIVLGVLGIMCLYQFFIKKEYKTTFLYGFILLLTFLFVSRLFLIADQGSVASTLNTSNEYERLMNNGYIGNFFNNLYYEKNVPWLIARTIQTLYFPIICQSSIAILFYLGVILKAIRYKSIDGLDLACTFMFFTGCALTLVMGHPTFSQTYFLMASYPYAALFGLKSISEFTIRNGEEKYRLKKAVAISKTAIIISLSIVGIRYFFTSYHFKQAWGIGIGNYLGDSRPVLEVSKNHLYNYISDEDYEAYVWIQENTVWEDLFTSNLCLDEEIVRPYILGVFSERHILMDNEGLIESLMKGRKAPLRKLTEQGIKYIVCYKRISPRFYGEKLGLERVFDNNAIAVYRIDWREYE